jgi:hypothetical protein
VVYLDQADGRSWAPHIVKRIVVNSGVLAITWLYAFALVAAIDYVSALPAEAHWSALFPTRQSAVVTWVVLWHTMAVILVSATFALHDTPSVRTLEYRGGPIKLIGELVPESACRSSG